MNLVIMKQMTRFLQCYEEETSKIKEEINGND